MRVHKLRVFYCFYIIFTNINFYLRSRKYIYTYLHKDKSGRSSGSPNILFGYCLGLRALSNLSWSSEIQCVRYSSIFYAISMDSRNWEAATRLKWYRCQDIGVMPITGNEIINNNNISIQFRYVVDILQ